MPISKAHAEAYTTSTYVTTYTWSGGNRITYGYAGLGTVESVTMGVSHTCYTPTCSLNHDWTEGPVYSSAAGGYCTITSQDTVTNAYNKVTTWTYVYKRTSADVESAGTISLTHLREVSVSSGYWSQGTSTISTTNHANPTITADPYHGKLNEAVPNMLFAGNVTPKSGYSGALFSNYGGGYSGTVTEIAETYSSAVTAGRWSSLGVFSQQLLATDVIDVANTTPATTTRSITVALDAAPDVVIAYKTGDKAGQPYDGEWTKEELGVTVSSSAPGSYNGKVAINGADVGTAASPYTHSIVYSPPSSSSAAGDEVTGVLVSQDASATLLSEWSAPQAVFIDNENPIPGLTYSSLGGFADDSQDTLSGVDRSATEIAVGPPGFSPTSLDYEPVNNVSVTVPGRYDVWVRAVDNAGNTAEALELNNALIASSLSPYISGQIASILAPEQNHTAGEILGSGSWSNEDVKVTVYCTDSGTDFIPGDHKNKISDDATTPGLPLTAVDYHDPVDITYTDETTGITVTGAAVNDADDLLSAQATFVVRIDKTKPAGNLDFNAGSPDYSFTDTSTDIAGAANSDIDATKTMVSIVPAGAPQPVGGAYVNLATNPEIPLIGYFDVWVIATDNAGNESTPVRALAHISRDGLDKIDAQDFAWDIASGSTNLDDDMAKMLSHVASLPQGSLVPQPLSSISVEAGDLAAIRTAIDNGQKGTRWNLEFKTSPGSTQAARTIQVTLFDSGPDPRPISPPGPLANGLIYANNFNWGISTGALGEGDAKAASFVTAFDTDGNSILTSFLGVDQHQLISINDAIAGGEKDTTWPLTFSTPDGTTTTVNVTLFDCGPKSPLLSGVEHIVGNNIKWGITTGVLDEPIAEFLSSATATSATGSALDLSYVTANFTELDDINKAVAAGQTGTTWPLTFTTSGLTGLVASVTVDVTLYDDGSASSPAADQPYIVANNFSWDFDKGVLSQDDAKNASSVAALSSLASVGSEGDISVDQGELAAINAIIISGIVPDAPVSSTFTYTEPGTLQTVSATAKVTLLGYSDVEVMITTDKLNPLPGDMLTYTIAVANSGTAAAQGVWVKDYVPQNTSFISCDEDGVYGVTASGKELVNWFIPLLAAGEEQVFTLTVKVDECVPGTELWNIANFEESGKGLAPKNMAGSDPGLGTSNVAVSIVANPQALRVMSNPYAAGRGFPFTGDSATLLLTGGAACAIFSLIAIAGVKRRRNG